MKNVRVALHGLVRAIAKYPESLFDAAGWPSGWLLRSIKISLPLTAGSAAK